VHLQAAGLRLAVRGAFFSLLLLFFCAGHGHGGGRFSGLPLILLLSLLSSVSSQSDYTIEDPNVVQPWNGDSSLYLMGTIHYTNPLDPALSNGQLVLDAVEEWLFLNNFHARIVSAVRPFLDFEVFNGLEGGSTLAAVSTMNAYYLSSLSVLQAQAAAAAGLSAPSEAEEGLESGVYITIIFSTNTSDMSNLQMYQDTIRNRMFSNYDMNVNISDPDTLNLIPWALRPADPLTGAPLSSYDWVMGMWTEQVWLCHNGLGVGEESGNNYLKIDTNVVPGVPYPYAVEAEESVKVVYDQSCYINTPNQNPVGFGVGFSFGIVGFISLTAGIIIYDVKQKKLAAAKLQSVDLKTVLPKTLN